MANAHKIHWKIRGSLLPGYFISPTGNDTTGDGTIGNPWATIGKFHTNAAAPGDILYMRGGTYDSFTTPNLLTKDGTDGNLITIQNYPGEIPILDGINMPGGVPGMENNYSLALNSANWWHIKGIHVKRSPSGGIILYNASSNNIFERCVTFENGRVDTGDGTGFRIYNTAANNLILNCDSHHNRDQSGDGGNADGFSSASSGNGNIFRYCRAYFNSDDGFDFFNTIPATTAGTVLIDRCWAWRNGYNEALDSLGNGYGFKLGGISSGSGATSSIVTIRNCLAWLNKAGYTQNTGNGGAVAIVVINNVSYDSQLGNSFIISADLVSTVKNNIEYSDASGASIHATVDESNNSWNGGVTVSATDFVTLDDTANRGVRQSDGSLPASDFLHLAVGSDLIDAGVDVGLAYLGAAPDLGAYERE